MYKALGYERYGCDGDCFAVRLRRPEDKKIFWIDLWIDNTKDVCTDWDQWIFHLDDEEDMYRKKIQENNDEFDDASSSAICYLEAKGVIRQDDDAYWYYVNKE